jgi:cold shock CspA family protein
MLLGHGGKNMKGIVRWYSNQGYGFIDPAGSTDGKAIYYHLCDVRNRTVFKTGDVVTFDVVQTIKGPKCINVQAAVQATDIKENLQCQQATL